MGRNSQNLRLEYLRPGSDGNTIICISDSGSEVCISLSGEGRYHSYVTELLDPGCRLNAIECKNLDSGSVLPELLILDPDYLVDITTVAGCFESYGNTPLTAVVKRLRTADDRTPAILLGNFAGELLDESVRRREGTQFDYAAAVTDFFRNHALDIAATSGFCSPEFHRQALSQQRNIENAVRRLIHEAMPDAERDRMVTEPTFFCELLGLQGRMDLITDDFRLVVEQKSGKGAFGSKGSEIPVPRIPHLVQLTLYRAILSYGGFVDSGALESFLLYSRYDRPLLPAAGRKELLRSAMELRNRIVATEKRLTAPGGYDLLDRLTPESMNVAGVSGTLWEKYTRPQLASQLGAYHTASDIEKMYVRRMLEFIAREHAEAKCGFNELLCRGGFSSSWTRPLDERVAQGEIYIGLKINGLIFDHSGKVEGVSLDIPREYLSDAADFRVGDIVALYKYDDIPDIRAAVVVRANIQGFSERGIQLRLRALQPEKIFADKNALWAVEQDFYESSFRPAYRNIYNLLYAEPERRDMILRPHERLRRYELKGDYGDFNTPVLNAMRSDGIFAIIGPPGTGKTSFGLMNVLREELADPDSSVVLTAYTNRAVDEICSKLCAAGLDFIRLGSGNSVPAAYTGFLIGERVRGCANITDLRKVLMDTRVFVGTTHTLNSGCPLFRLRGFTLAIVDEASQILEPQLLGLLAAMTDRGVPAVRRFLLIGDHKQLPAVVSQSPEASRVESDELRGIGLTDCRDSFFERFLRAATLPDGTLNPGMAYRFTRQGRMHAGVAEFASRMFYNGELSPVPLEHQTCGIPSGQVYDSAIGELLNSSRMIFINVEPEEIPQGNINVSEARKAVEVAVEIYRREGAGFDPDMTIGIIVPYRMQGAAIRSLLQQTALPGLERITIDTVERFQGGQRQYMIYSTTVCRPAQLAFLTSSRFCDTDGKVIDRKLNVALTRAVSHNIVIGNGPLLATDPLYACLMKEGVSSGMNCLRGTRAEDSWGEPALPESDL